MVTPGGIRVNELKFQLMILTYILNSCTASLPAVHQKTADCRVTSFIPSKYTFLFSVQLPWNLMIELAITSAPGANM
jgi:hypothetical protein